jgi:hypothetical protein
MTPINARGAGIGYVLSGPQRRARSSGVRPWRAAHGAKSAERQRAPAPLRRGANTKVFCLRKYDLPSGLNQNIRGGPPGQQAPTLPCVLMVFDFREEPSLADCGFRAIRMQQAPEDDPLRISLMKIMQSNRAADRPTFFFVAWRKGHKQSTLSAATPNTNARIPNAYLELFPFLRPRGVASAQPCRREMVQKLNLAKATVRLRACRDYATF